METLFVSEVSVTLVSFFPAGSQHGTGKQVQRGEEGLRGSQQATGRPDQGGPPAEERNLCFCSFPTFLPFQM